MWQHYENSGNALENFPQNVHFLQNKVYIFCFTIAHLRIPSWILYPCQSDTIHIFSQNKYTTLCTLSQGLFDNP